MRRYLGAEIRGELAAQGLEINDLVQRSGVERTSLWRYLRGDRPMPLDVLFSVAEALGMDASELVERAEKRARRDTKP